MTDHRKLFAAVGNLLGQTAVALAILVLIADCGGCLDVGDHVRALLNLVLR